MRLSMSIGSPLASGRSAAKSSLLKLVKFIAGLPLASPVFRLAPVDPRIERLAKVAGRHHAGELLALYREPLRNRSIEAARHRGDDARSRERRMTQDASG